MSYIQLSGITKSFGTVKANNNISLSVEKGEIHALLGENGSGKSTLMNMLAGIYSPDSGTITLGGREMRFASPKDSIAAGIGMVHQHFKLVDVLTARENIIAGRPGGLFTGGSRLSDEISALADKYGLAVHTEKKIYDMSVSEKQTVEILKVLYRGADVLILDEPTAVLTPQEIRTLFDILRNMKKQGCAVIIITHKLGEVMEISDRVTVLRKGETIGTVNTGETNVQKLTEMMVGRPVTLEIDRPDTDPELVRDLLDVNGLCVAGAELGDAALTDVSFTLRAGEILGVAGVGGSGQKELCECIAGLIKPAKGAVTLNGKNIAGLNPREIIEKGEKIGFVPEDRLGMGLVGGMSIAENIYLRSYRDDKSAMIDRKKQRAHAVKLIERFNVDTPSPEHQVKKLSGGNIQKVLLGREIDRDPELLIVAYPVRGLDIGASYNIYDELNMQKQKGVGVLMIGEDLDVLLALSDRILVLYQGRVQGIVDARSISKEALGLLMLGQKSEVAE